MMDEFRPKFIRVLKKYGATDTDGQEYFQISLKAVVEHFILDKNKAVPDSKFFNYLTTIGLNQWRTYCKQKGREISSDELPDTTFESTILEDMMRKEKHAAFMQQFRGLNKGCQDLLWKKIVEEMNYKEIANHLNKSEQYLRVQLNRCKKYLINSLSSDNSFQFK